MAFSPLQEAGSSGLFWSRRSLDCAIRMELGAQVDQPRGNNQQGLKLAFVDVQ